MGGLPDKGLMVHFPRPGIHLIFITRVWRLAQFCCCCCCCCFLAPCQGCTVYQFCAAGGNCVGASGNSSQCWTGQFSNCGGDPRKGWVGMGHSSGPRPEGKTLITGVRVAHNSFQHTAKATQATKSMSQTNASAWVFDFCDVLLFPQIAYAKVWRFALPDMPRVLSAFGGPVGRWFGDYPDYSPLALAGLQLHHLITQSTGQGSHHGGDRIPDRDCAADAELHPAGGDVHARHWHPHRRGRQLRTKQRLQLKHRRTAYTGI